MANDERLRAITIEGGRTVYINVLNIRSFQNFESKLIIEMRDGTTYLVDGAPNVNTFYTSTFALSPVDVAITGQPIEIDIVTNPVPTETTITNVPLITQESLQALTINAFVTTVGTSSITLLSANANRKYLLLHNHDHTGNSVVYVRFDASPATLTNGFPITDGSKYEFPHGYIYTGEIRVISDTANTPFAVMEGS